MKAFLMVIVYVKVDGIIGLCKGASPRSNITFSKYNAFSGIIVQPHEYLGF